MADVIIRAEGLGKSYNLRHQRSGERYVALRDVLTDKARDVGRRLLGRPGAANAEGNEEFWALRDVSFEVPQGEVLGIIGRNGAGKSTLLKVLSRITEPTEGRVRIKGRVASLLEVGTGFHPELTGRENIYLNGAILGMSRAEVRRNFDEIVAFAEVERFLDTPVKRYSSGMYVRLAFAVAAHLEPEILIVDEVLAVGDMEFQKKCLGKLRNVSAGGRTVLFVSHNMAAIKSLTSRVFLLDQGAKVFEGPTQAGIEKYVHLFDGTRHLERRPNWGKGNHSGVLSARLLDENGRATLTYKPGSVFRVEVMLVSDGTIGLSLEGFLLDASRARIACISEYHFAGRTLPNSPGQYVYYLEFEPLWLASGRYSFDLAIAVANVNWDHFVENAVEFEIAYSNPGEGSWDFRNQEGYGAIAMVPRSGTKCEPANSNVIGPDLPTRCA